MITLQTILVPTDFSELSQHAFRTAGELATHFHAQLIVMHVAQNSVTIAGEAEVTPYSEEYLQEQSQRLEEYRAPESIALRRHLAQGEPAAEILQAVRTFHADLLVMGTHGRSGLSRLVLGSVAEKVIRTAPCPVLTIRNETWTGDSIQEASEESFPASDAPSWSPLHVGSPVHNK